AAMIRLPPWRVAQQHQPGPQGRWTWRWCPASGPAWRPTGARHAYCALLIPLEDGFLWYGRIDGLIAGNTLADQAHRVGTDSTQTGQLQLEEDRGIHVIASDRIALQHDTC